MKTILVDGDFASISAFEKRVQNIAEIQMAGIFDNGWKALQFVEKNEIDLVILAVEINGIDGISLGHCLREKYPDILLLFLSEQQQYAMDAIRLHAVDYLMKPFTQEELVYALETARLLSRRRKRKVFVKTFGHFDVFVNHQPIMFRSGKAKELLALLVDRQGGTVSTDQVICALWEERPNDEATQNLCSKVSKSLHRELEKYGAQEIFITKRGVRRVDTELFDCDLYELLAGKEQARRKFVGDYMLDYSWAEERMGLLNQYILGR
jgi:two-component SAPR family response regulator